MKNPLVYLFEKMWQYAGPNRRSIVLYSVLLLGANIVISLEPLVIGLFLNAVQTEGIVPANFFRMMLLVSMVFVLEILFWSMHGPARVIENRNAFRVRANYKNFLLRGVFGLPIEWHTDHHSGDTIDKIEKGSMAIFNFSSKTFEMEQSVIMLAVSLAVLILFSPTAAAAAVIMSAGTFWALTLFDKKLIPGYQIVNNLENRISAKIFDAVSNIYTIIVLRSQRLVLRSLENEIKKPYWQYDINVVTNELKWFFASLMGRLIVVVTIGVYLVLNLGKGAILAGTVYILFNYANRIREVFYHFAYSYHDIVSYRASVANAEELPVDFASIDAKGKKCLPRNWNALSVTDLSFTHSGAAQGAIFGLCGLAMDIKKGEHIALIGASGAGKSTLLKIIRDLHRPLEMKLTVDNCEIAAGFAAISDSISLIPQEPEIFATTIKENITMGIDQDLAAIKRFARMALFGDVVRRLPKGYDSSVVEKGVNLSGGEKQRLALARGLIASQDKDIILLDEPTSSVDFHTELAIYENLFGEFKNKTIISAVHKLYLLPMFDKIYFLKDGQMIASGSFDELKLGSSDFRSLWEEYIAKN